jgi:predicted transcriptional regulator YdeE
VEKITVENEVSVFCVKAMSFPAGIEDAFHKIMEILTQKNDMARAIYGISKPDAKHNIQYWACATIANGESLSDYQETYTIKKGEYISIVVNDFAKDLLAVGRAFQTLLQNPEIAPDGECIEWYIGKDSVRCMVRLK